MVRIDLSEYSERHAVSRLIGSLPGYVGAGRQLTEPVRRRPHSVVLLDEVEKAHPDLFTVLLQVLDDGRGRTSGFASTVPIMTGNLSSDLAGSSTHGAFGFVQPADELRERLMRRLRASFRPELLSRIDEIVVFRPLEADQLDWITGLLPVRAKRGSHAKGHTVEFTPVRISELGYGPQFGARPLRRAIQRLGFALGDGLLRGLTPLEALFAAVAVFVVRPLTGIGSLIRSTARGRAALVFFDVRGIGTLDYLARELHQAGLSGTGDAAGRRERGRTCPGACGAERTAGGQKDPRQRARGETTNGEYSTNGLFPRIITSGGNGCDETGNPVQ
ncbi:C-terminal, D2-small domain-containing protein, of ClpB protein [Amycolatopsis rubida]|uniref:C-terminal, D2-small domain-containing protein, of ClpB protein n=1 Tax=Amycolatopsis rubida TaxID=112413 RepID=A0A1I5KCX7_9PSEU|nr:C-terminal, D2-small domain-containing protein, of ClpB protein [Amycolatopsis rubida]